MALTKVGEKTNEEEDKSETKLEIGMILPISQIVGYRVIKSIEGENINYMEVEKLSEAEVLSFIYKNARFK